MMSYVGSQADKFNEATVAMNELLTTLPELPVNLDLAKIQVKKDIQTERITQDNIIFNYLNAKQLGLKEDTRKELYSSVDAVTMNDLKNFHKNNFSGKPYTYAIVASEKKVAMDDMKKLGDVKKITLEEIFGY
jgi:predicted Zn-dependent peptidase